MFNSWDCGWSCRVTYASVFSLQVSLWLTNLGWPWLEWISSTSCDFLSFSKQVRIVYLTISEVQGREGTESLLKPRLLSEPSLPLLYSFDLRKITKPNHTVKGWRKKMLISWWNELQSPFTMGVYTERSEEL